MQPWHALSELEGLQGVLSEWKNFPHSFLQITNGLASTVRCPEKGGCYLNVVSHEDSHVGICTSYPRRCHRTPLRKADLLLYRLNTNALLKKVAEASSCQYQQEQLKHLSKTWHIGHISPQGEYRFPVFVSLCGRASELDHVVAQLSFQQQPYLLVGISRAMFSYPSLENTRNPNNGL